MRTLGVVCSCVGVAAALCAPALSAAPPASAGDAIFQRAVSAAQTAAKAPYATYTVVVTVTNGDRRSVSSWPTTEDLTHGVVMASSFSDEERAAPATPHGANVVARRRFALTGPRSLGAGVDPAARLSINSSPMNPERTGDEVGPVALAVDQDFGLTPPHRYRLAHDDATVVAAGEELATIGRTGTIAARYRVDLLETEGGVAHLALTPLRDAYHNRLRELWVDAQTGDVQAAIVQGVGDRPPFDSVRWQATFARVQGATYLSDVHTLDPLHIGRTTPDVSIDFEKLDLRSTSPVSTTFGIEAPVRYLRDP